MSQTRVVTIHQPNFLPWMGFFHKMALADVFILLDNVPFTKNGFQNRVKIKSAQGEQWLTVPVLTKGRSGQLTCDVQINNKSRWQRVHLAALRTNYQRAPYYEAVLAWLQPWYEKSWTFLVDFNRPLIEEVMRQLRLQAELVNASSLSVEGSGSELLLRLVRQVGGNVYLSGSSGRSYLDIESFERAGITVRFQEFHHPVYPQLYGEFIPGLSVLDLLMNVGPLKAAEYLQCSVPA
ncbi:MAG: hypothetical protein D6791_10240 [Chloroflexi bacterium]|nr:MAG: hypothetical protein D6791_10240 [Chloroflexota bacterium]